MSNGSKQKLSFQNKRRKHRVGNGMRRTTHQWVRFELTGVQHAALGPRVRQSMMHKVEIVIGADNLKRTKMRKDIYMCVRLSQVCINRRRQ